MKKTIIISLILVLMGISALANIDEITIKNCFKVTNITCVYPKCIAVDINIVNGENEEDNFVGDYFTYDITIISLGNDSIENDTFNVNTSNPIREQIGYRKFSSDKIKVSNIQYRLYPSYRNNLNEHDIIFFDSAGVYKITLSSDIPVEYLRFHSSNCRYIRTPNVFEYYFDAMPKWEKRWKEETEKLQKDMIESNKQIKDSVEKMITISDNMEKSGNYMVLLTTIIGLFTIITTYYAGKGRKLFFWFIIIIIVLILYLKPSIISMIFESFNQI